MTTTTHNPLYAATADRLALMFRRAEAYADDRDDITRAIEALAGRDSHLPYLRGVLDRLAWASDDDVVTLTHEERVSLYVASKAYSLVAVCAGYGESVRDLWAQGGAW